ncbi:MULTISPECIES: GNAT family N-acetyltransferase [unclassified Bacillus (in: firmicutes)]|uniref:GNAT family N-acetyltransferase n=1 Tax=unclassified Bacillus (in: firmicutes) TaxID=185979 RepID=UPI0008ED408E|nr:MULTISPECIES: GNAT family N-acetyltransferase [unclassified Bacillus (in: firmicutes)]SFA87205.1 Protein N-acetyltransferase, RimJ/RimL family [Bacillus sp. UNCCL13]SFQ84124.1 Protein N-acetyltransferase, RimJ/RimL family [Bacillus sp. cl95]
MVNLVPHSLDFAERIFQLSSDEEVNHHLSFKDDSVEETKWFITHIINEEKEGRAVSRVILDDRLEPIGLTTLMSINHDKRSCHLGSWLGKDYWGKGYNQEAKEQILEIAFEQLGLERVFAGARAENIRSQKAQEKLPYITLNVQDLYPQELETLEKKEKVPCVLHAFFKEDFLKYKAKARISALNK